MGYVFLARARMAEEWKLWSCLTITFSLLRSFMANLKVALADPHQNTMVSSKRA
jgi:hypothetical protein